MNILYINNEGFDTPNSNNHLNMTMIDDFLKNGLNVHLIASHRKGIYPDIPKILENRNGFTYDIIKRSVVIKTHLIRRYLNEAMYAFKAMKKWRKEPSEIDVVYIQNNPASVFHVFLLSAFLRKPIVLTVFDIFPGHAYDVGAIKSKLLMHIFEIIQKCVYRKVKSIVVVSEDMKHSLLRIGVREEKVCVINLWFDTQIYREIQKSENVILRDFQIPTHMFIVQFAGLLSFVLDYKIIIDVAKILQHEKSIIFMVVGDGNFKDDLLEEVKEKRLANIKYFPWQPLERIVDLYNACDIGFIPLKKGVIKGSYPSKACQLWACKKPIICTVEDSNFTSTVNNKRLGISISDFNPQSVANAILYMFNNRKALNEMGENGYAYTHDNYKREVNTQMYVELLRKSI